MYLIVNGKRMKKKKSSPGKSGDPSNPIWNEAFTFNLSQSNLQNAALEVLEFSKNVLLHKYFKLKLLILHRRFMLFHLAVSLMRLEVVESVRWNMV